MKLSHQLSLCFVVLFLLTAFIVMGHNLAQAEEKPVAERLVSINLEDQDFTQALKAIADQAGITINIHGQAPTGKRDITLKQVPLNQALAHVLRLYGVRNHAAAYNPDTGTVMLAILETSPLVAALSPQLPQNIDLGISDTHPLSIEQMNLLAEIDLDQFNDEKPPLTLEQLLSLEELNDQEEETSRSPLSPDQMESLKELDWNQNQQIFADENQPPLTQKQMESLLQHNPEDLYESQHPLTLEEMRKLEELDKMD